MSDQATVKFSEFIDLLLARLLELEHDGRPGAVFDLNAVAQELKVTVPPQWVFDAGKVLESRGWARVAFTFGGGCWARLTGEGRLYVEEERGTGIIRKYREAPGQFIAVSGVGHQVIVGSSTGAVSQSVAIEQERAPAFRVLGQLKHALRQDATLTVSEREDLLTDVEMIEQQLRKREPNRPALAALLEPLSRIASIAGFVADLIQWFNQ
jgi:hypothetical protein